MAFAAGVLGVLFRVAEAAIFVAVVDKGQYVEGNSLVYGSRAMSFMAGPSLGGLLVQAFSAPFALLADALSFLGSAFFLIGLASEQATSAASTGAVATTSAAIRYANGLAAAAAPQLPCVSATVAVVMPQNGHGTPVSVRSGQGRPCPPVWAVSSG